MIQHLNNLISQIIKHIHMKSTKWFCEQKGEPKTDNSKEDMKRARWKIMRREKVPEKRTKDYGETVKIKTVNNHRQQWGFDGRSHWTCVFLWKYMKLPSSTPGKFERHQYKVLLVSKMKLLSLFQLLVQQNQQIKSIRFLIDALPKYFIIFWW